MARLNFVKCARKDHPEAGIKKGDSYYWWEFRFGGKYKSKDRPRRSRLTQSAFNATLWDIEDDLSEASAQTQEDLESLVEDIKSRIEELRDETQENLDNMPESLQYGSTGELLQERIDGLDSWASDIEDIDIEIDIDEIRENAFEELSDVENNEEAAEQLILERIGEEVENRLEEIKGTDAGL